LDCLSSLIGVEVGMIGFGVWKVWKLRLSVIGSATFWLFKAGYSLYSVLESVDLSTGVSFLTVSIWKIYFLFPRSEWFNLSAKPPRERPHFSSHVLL